MSPSESIRELVLPVVMISANGLICLALYNRLAAITARYRGYGREQFEMESRLLELTERESFSPRLIAPVRTRLRQLANERGSSRLRAGHIRNALILLLAAVIGMLSTSLLLALGQETPLPTLLPLGVFLAAVGLMIGGVTLAIRELIQFADVMQSCGAEEASALEREIAAPEPISSDPFAQSTFERHP